jgi:hypothetical protein
MPVYFEPVFKSGERITIAVAAISGDQSIVFETLDSVTIRAMYKNRAVEISNLIELVTDSLRLFIAKYSSLYNWNPPISGVFSGHIANAEGIRFEHIVNQGVQSCSSLSSLYTPDEAEDVSHIQVRTLIKNTLLAINEGYKDCLNKSVSFENGRSKTYGILHPKLASNIVVATRGTNSENSGLVKMMDLNALKLNPFSEFTSIELIVAKPVGKVLCNEYVNKIKDESSFYGIKCIVVDDAPESIAEYINDVIDLKKIPSYINNERIRAYG